MRLHKNTRRSFLNCGRSLRTFVTPKIVHVSLCPDKLRKDYGDACRRIWSSMFNDADRRLHPVVSDQRNWFQTYFINLSHVLSPLKTKNPERYCEMEFVRLFLLLPQEKHPRGWQKPKIVFVISLNKVCIRSLLEQYLPKINKLSLL